MDTIADIPILYIVAVPAAAAVLMQLLLVARIQAVLPRLRGSVCTRPDLDRVKGLINYSMRLAVWYLALFGLFILALAVLMILGMPFGRAMACMFWFGGITLTAGLFGRRFDLKIRRLRVVSNDPQLDATFQRLLVQWREARYQLPD